MKNYLLSFAYPEFFRLNSDVLQDPECNVLVDSGAFTLWNSKIPRKPIVVEEYAKFCEGLRSGARCGVRFANLDVIPGSRNRAPTSRERDLAASKSWEHYEFLLSRNLKVMPIFHQYDDFKWLKKMHAESEYFGVSPSNLRTVSTKQKDHWLKEVFSRIGYSRRTHAFGMTSGVLLHKFPFYSADSTTWMKGVVRKKNRPFVFFNHRNLSVIQCSRALAKRYLRDSLIRWTVTESETFQEASQEFLEKYYQDPPTQHRCGVRAFLELEESVTEMWADRGYTWPQEFGAVASRGHQGMQINVRKLRLSQMQGHKTHRSWLNVGRGQSFTTGGYYRKRLLQQVTREMRGGEGRSVARSIREVLPMATKGMLKVLKRELSNLKHARLSVWLAYCVWDPDKDGAAIPEDKLKKATGFTGTDTVRKAKNWLEGNGWLVRELPKKVRDEKGRFKDKPVSEDWFYPQIPTKKSK